MKTLMDKKVNRTAKRLNKQVREDVFGKRFEVRQYQKTCRSEIQYYLYQFIDNKQPERNKVIERWFSGFEIITFHALDIEMNDFIVNSDFWTEYRKSE